MILKTTAKAFSLVELLIVIAIVTIIGTIATSSFVKYRGNACLRDASRKITGDIYLCKQMAVAEIARYRILINAGNNNYVIQKETSQNHWASISTIKNIGGDDKAVKIIGDPIHTIYFQPRGTTTGGTLELQHEKYLSKVKIVTSLMGRVRVEYDLK